MSDTKTVLLVGATGAVGVPTVRALRDAGHEVRALVRSAERGRVAEAAGAEPVVGDLFEASSVVPHLDGVDALLNLATRIPTPARAALPGAWKENDRIRTDGSRALVDAAIEAGVPRFVQESVVFQYADGGDRWLDEDAPVERMAVVDSTAASESNVARFTEHGGTGVVLRFGLFYGPNSTHTDSTAALVRRGLSPALGAPGAYQPSLHLDDAASAVVASLDVPSGTYNVTDDEPLTRVGYAHAVAQALGVKDPRLVPQAVVKAMGKKVDPI
ncbi:hypothetical protein B7486_61840, partial [cyanobacterium TDX16]